MEQNLTLLLTIRTLTQQGEKILGNRWLPFIDYLRNELGKHGSESELSNDNLLIFTFPQGLAAFAVLLNTLTKSKQEHGWPASSGPCPLQIVMDLVPLGNGKIAIQPPDSTFWDTLHQEAIYITASLEQEWLVAVTEFDQFPPHKIEADGSGLSRVIFPDHDLDKTPKLLAFRGLPVAGKGVECFYCGMTSHHPSQCPSKFLAMSSWALSDVGYLTFAELNNLYKNVFSENANIVSQLAAGVKTAQIRSHPELLTFIAFFDISAIYQPRFLWNFAFSGYSAWDSIFLCNRIKIDNRNLHLGLDCLRVGQHDQALEILNKENKRKDGDRFAANIGLAFCSLELNRPSDMVRYLKEARNIAHQTKDIIYSNLLLSRYYEFAKDFWNAKEAVTNALKADYDCLDVQYRRVQLAVREGLSERELKQLRSLVIGQKDLYMKALLDPQLQPIQGLVEKILSQQHAIIAKDAQRHFANAKQEVLTLEVWLEEKDKRRDENKSSIQQLEKQLARKSYFDLLEVSERSNGLFFNCQRLHKEYSVRLNKELNQLSQGLDMFHTFWKGYGYKKFFKQFQPTLLSAMKKNQQACSLLKEGDSESIRKAIQFSAQVRTDFATIKKEYGRLLWLRTSLNGLKLFVKRLLIGELCIIILLALLLPLLTSGLAGKPALAWLVELAGNKDVQRNTLIIATLFIAPFISLAWTMLDLSKN